MLWRIKLSWPCMTMPRRLVRPWTNSGLLGFLTTASGSAAMRREPQTWGLHVLPTSSATFARPESRVRSLTRLDVPEDDAHLYAEGVRRGGTLLIGEVSDDNMERALAIIERSSPVDLDERGEHYRTAGWSRYDAGADYTVEQAAEERSRYGTGLRSAAAEFRQANQVPPVGHREAASGEEETIPVVEEQIDIGKRAVERGGVRVRTYVRETPVEEQVTLREEHVRVERRPVDRAADDPDAGRLPGPHHRGPGNGGGSGRFQDGSGD